MLNDARPQSDLLYTGTVKKEGEKYTAFQAELSRNLIIGR
jgi:hypothetical protein